MPSLTNFSNQRFDSSIFDDIVVVYFSQRALLLRCFCVPNSTAPTPVDVSRGTMLEPCGTKSCAAIHCLRKLSGHVRCTVTLIFPSRASPFHRVVLGDAPPSVLADTSRTSLFHCVMILYDAYALNNCSLNCYTTAPSAPWTFSQHAERHCHGTFLDPHSRTRSNFDFIRLYHPFTRSASRRPL